MFKNTFFLIRLRDMSKELLGKRCFFGTYKSRRKGGTVFRSHEENRTVIPSLQTLCFLGIKKKGFMRCVCCGSTDVYYLGYNAYAYCAYCGYTKDGVFVGLEELSRSGFMYTLSSSYRQQT